MIFELIFTYGILAFAVICSIMWLKRTVWGQQLMRSLQHPTSSRFCARHPRLCDKDDNFYCFFRKDVFRTRR